MPGPSPGATLIADLTPPSSTIIARLAKAVTGDPHDVLTLASFTECDFPGYAPVPISDWEDVAPEDTMVAQALSAILLFEASALIVTQQVAVACYFTFLKTGFPEDIYQVELFPTPFAFTHPGDSLQRQLRVHDTPDPVPSIDGDGP